MRRIFLLFVLTFYFPFTSIGQINTNFTLDSIQSNLVDFLIKKGEINENLIDEFKIKKGKIHIIGLINGYSKNKLIDGIYSFSAPISHTRTYYLIIEEEKYTILDLSNIEGLNIAISNTLSFCERKKYCSDLSKIYISGMISIFYKNKNPTTLIEKNCEKNLKNTKELP